jgi:hypothetical protein
MIINLFKYYKRRKALKKSNFGRSEGWIVELNGKKIAEFINPLAYDHFAFVYELIVLDESLEKEMENYEFWDTTALRFISKAVNEYYDGPKLNIRPYEDTEGKYITVKYLCLVP